MTLLNFFNSIKANESYENVGFTIYDKNNTYQYDFMWEGIESFLRESDELGDDLKQKIINYEPACFSEDGRLYELTLYIDRPLKEVPEDIL